MKKLKLYGAKGQGKFAIVDDDIYEKVSWYPWKLDSTGYPRAHLTRLHNIVLPGSTVSQQVDHINRDKLDNRRENLRLVDRSVNSTNREARTSSGEKHIMFRADRNLPYWVGIYIGGTSSKKTKYLGSYKTLEEAIIAREEGYKEYGISNLGREGRRI